MTNEVVSKVRLVRCPKCRQVLQEPTELIVYRCGGCNAVLQAKKRKNDNSSAELRVLETQPRDSKEKEKEISSLHNKDSSISSVDTFRSESFKTQYEFGECSKEKFSGELHLSPQLGSSFRENDDDNGNSSSARECIDGSSVGFKNDLIVDRNLTNFSDELPESNELKHHEIEACEVESSEYTNSLAGSSPFTRCSHENADAGKSRSLSQESDQNDFAGQTVEYIENAKSSGEIISSECGETEKPSPVHTEVDQSPLHEGVLSDAFVSVQQQSGKEIDRLAHRDMAKFPTTRSYYAYDGSASSCDDGDNDNQVPNKFSQQIGRKFENAKLKSTEEFQSDDECLSRKPRTHHPAKNSSQMLPRRMHRDYQNEEKWPESRRRDQTFGHRRQLMMDECVSTSHDSCGHWQNDFHHHSSFYPSNTPIYADRDKMELLRMVYDLESQLQQTRLSKGKADRNRFHAGDMNAPLYSHHFPKMSRIPFSAEAVHYGDCPCLHCSPVVWHRSSQLPLGSICCKKSHLAAYTNHNYYTSPEYSKRCQEPKPSDQRKLHIGERYAKTRHVLPFLGGAPIVSCHYCSELLQLPADFGLFKRKCYKLRCNSCKKVLEFNFHNRTDVVPSVISDDMVEKPESLAPAPPPSEAGESERKFSLAPKRCPHAESLSYSDDDLGPSFCRSCSTEVEPVEDRKMKSVMRELSRSKPGNSWKQFESSGPSNWGKSSSEIEEEHPTSGSPLHRLMGYSTISQVFRNQTNT